MYQFQKAAPVWGENLTEKYNCFLGFRADVDAGEGTQLKIAIAARNYYRLYVNGKITLHGPARTAKGYCRVDECAFYASGKVKIAIEVASLGKLPAYCNDNTMEPGLLAAEISVESREGWKVTAATGAPAHKNPEEVQSVIEPFLYTELSCRHSMAELMSHSRGITEYYHLKADSLGWTTGDCSGFRAPVFLKEKVVFLKRRSPYPTLRPIPFKTLRRVKDIEPCEKPEADFIYELARSVNPKWYEMLAEEDMFISSLLQERETAFSGHWQRNADEIRLTDCRGAAAFVFSIPESEVGFLHFHVRAQDSAVIDVINADVANGEGVIRPNTYATRYVLEKGNYDLTSFEPKLARYIKLIIRTAGEIVFSLPELLDYTYPDEGLCQFECSDGELNLIYEGAKRTLRLNTLDIFMDCPQRERGGWLCDSHFTADAAWQLFGDLRVETDFIENFMLTSPDDYKDAFFPEVYPGTNHKEKSPGIQSWSFWLLTEFWDFIHRSGDRAFADRFFPRIVKFLDSVTKHIGKSGLFEDFDILFVDWSLSNEKFSLYPISLPVNCLIVRAFELMGQLYEVERWKETAAKVRKRIEELSRTVGCDCDGYAYENGKFVKNGCFTESGLALQLWSGFFPEDKSLTKAFVDAMGPCPKRRSNPNIGKSNLFIGLMIRFCVLARMGKAEELIRELKDIYLPQLLNGPGTLFECIHEPSGCHGFNAMAGSLIVNQVLGLGQPMQLTRTVAICPHPGDVAWACGNTMCADGRISLEWHADKDEHTLEMELILPEGWKPVVEIPFELKGWNVLLNGKSLSLLRPEPVPNLIPNQRASL